MIVALHEAPKGFFKKGPPYSNEQLLTLVRKTASLGFKAIEIRPLANYSDLEGERLKGILDELDMKRSVHVGGKFDASKFASNEEYYRLEEQIRFGVAFSNEIGSSSVSIHPPFFVTENEPEELWGKARTRFLTLLKEQVGFAYRKGVKLALESFCYRPFNFEGLDDFAQFVSNFPSERLGVLLDAGHVYQVGISLSEAIHRFQDRLLDVHVHDATLDKDYQKATHLPIGKGTLDFSSLVNLLREVSYDSWLTLEIRGSEKEVVGSKNFLTTLIGS